MKKPEITVLGALALIGVAVWLFSRPECGRGCRTVAEHLLEHGVKDLLAGLML